MKLMSYNILDGGNERLSLIYETIKRESPDYLTINEANSFANDENKLLKEVSQQIDLPYFDLALSGEYNYHVAVFSRYPLKEVHKLQSLMRACIVALVKTDLGLLSIASLHLTPYSEMLRLPEIDKVIDFQKKYDSRVLMGDLNSLSKHDNYEPKAVNKFNEIQIKKFGADGILQFEVIDKIISAGYYDAAAQMGKNKEFTVPTSINKDSAHSNIRLDYIFISKPLLSRLQFYSVVRNELTDKASDHYPIVAELK